MAGSQFRITDRGYPHKPFSHRSLICQYPAALHPHAQRWYLTLLIAVPDRRTQKMFGSADSFEYPPPHRIAEQSSYPGVPLLPIRLRSICPLNIPHRAFHVARSPVSATQVTRKYYSTLIRIRIAQSGASGLQPPLRTSARRLADACPGRNPPGLTVRVPKGCAHRIQNCIIFSLIAIHPSYCFFPLSQSLSFLSLVSFVLKPCLFLQMVYSPPVHRKESSCPTSRTGT